MVTTTNEPSDTKKRGLYPYYSLEKALGIGKIVASIGGNTGEVSRSTIAQELKVEDDSPVLVQTIAAAKCFGIIEGKGSFALTDDGKKYFMPTSNSDEQQAKFAFLEAPKVFEQLLKRYNGVKLPSNEMLANVVEKLSVPGSWKQRVASLFVSSLNDIGVIDSQGIVRFDAGKRQSSEGAPAAHGAGMGRLAAQSKTLDHGSKPFVTPPPAPPPPPPANTISFPIGPDRYLTVPKDLTGEDCNIIETMLPALKAYANRGIPKQNSPQPQTTEAAEPASEANQN